MWKFVCPYEYTNDWEKLSETLLPEEEDSYKIWKILQMQIMYIEKEFVKNLK